MGKLNKYFFFLAFVKFLRESGSLYRHIEQIFRREYFIYLGIMPNKRTKKVLLFYCIKFLGSFWYGKIARHALKPHFPLCT